MREINFICCGMMGDFIHSLSAIKNICSVENAIANIYISDNIGAYGGDFWKKNIYTTHYDLHDLVKSQKYVNKFSVVDNNSNGSYININFWRNHISGSLAENGMYTESWSEIMSKSFNYQIPKTYSWIDSYRVIKDTYQKVVIHRSIHRHNPLFDWNKVIGQINEEIIFLTFNENEYIDFILKYKSDNLKLKLVNTFEEMSNCIYSSKLFIGNQSAPFALASALDVPRLLELDNEAAPFYMNESKYSNNISWYLNDYLKHFTSNSIIKL